MRLYIAGKMRGVPFFGFPAFDQMRDDLLAAGHDPISPADHDREMGLDPTAYPEGEWGEVCPADFLKDAFAWDLAQVCQADGVVVLPGWEDSKGARLEVTVARDRGVPVYTFTPASGLSLITTDRPEVIVGITGYARAGKDTVANFLNRYGFQRIAFADALKDLARLAHPHIDHLVALKGWEEAKAVPEVRSLLQHLGNAARQAIAPDVWVQAALRHALPGQRYAVSDVRFPNEADAIRALGGRIIRVTRPGIGPINQHVSETAMDDYRADHYLANDGDLNDLADTVERLAVTLLRDAE